MVVCGGYVRWWCVVVCGVRCEVILFDPERSYLLTSSLAERHEECFTLSMEEKGGRNPALSNEKRSPCQGEIPFRTSAGKHLNNVLEASLRACDKGIDFKILRIDLLSDHSWWADIL